MVKRLPKEKKRQERNYFIWTVQSQVWWTKKLSVQKVNYLASSCVMVISLAEILLWIDEELALPLSLVVKKPGSFGWGNSLSLPNIITTDDMLGLSLGLRCTHNRPICIERSASYKLHDSTIDSAMSSEDLPSVNSLHAWH